MLFVCSLCLFAHSSFCFCLIDVKLAGRGFLFQQVDEEVREQKAEIKALSTFAQAVGWNKEAEVGDDDAELFDEEEQEILDGAAS